jgi:hypothetical protein
MRFLAEKIDVIPHGVPDLPFTDPNYFKDTSASRESRSF